MGKYDRWRAFFSGASGGQLELTFAELEELLEGPLPSSAHNHAAWWSGDRNHTVWRESGWVASPDLPRRMVVFAKTGETRPSSGRQIPVVPVSVGERLVLVGCVKTKVKHPAPAKDLYDSPLWRKRRRYAEATGMPWAILSAEHGMVDPDTVLEPYDRYLGNERTSYRRRWSAQTAQQIITALAQDDLRVVEIHAGAAYLNSGLRSRLESSGIVVDWPVEGMPFGVQLGWYP